MIRNRLKKSVCLVLLMSAVFCLFDGSGFVSVSADTTGDTVSLEDEEIDAGHILFVRRLYAVVTRQMHADEEEIYKLARSLDGGISAAYDVMYHFYFSDQYRSLGQSDEQFVEDLYTGCYGRYSDESGRSYYISMLESGYSRYLVFREFISSDEFVSLCYEYNIWVKKILIDNYIDHLNGMTCICDDYYDLDEDGGLDWCYKDAAKHVRCINEFYYDSPTDYYIIADVDNCYIEIFKGSIGQWSLYKIYPMSCGKRGHETPRGNYKVTKKLSYFYSHGSLCYYATQWNGPYYLHSVTYNYNGTLQNGTLGKHISAGCIRLKYSVAKWVYDTIPIGTPVKTV